MKNEIKQYLSDFLLELKENTLSDLRENDRHYNELLHKTVTLTEHSLYDDKTFKKVDELSETYNEIGSIEQDVVYFQGYLDCIKLLKLLGCL